MSQLLQDFPALKDVIDHVEMVPGVIEYAEVSDHGGRGAALRLTFAFDSCGISYSFYTMEAVTAIFETVGARAVPLLRGKQVRIEYVTLGSWTPFFRVWHSTDKKNFLVSYAENELARHAEGERV